MQIFTNRLRDRLTVELATARKLKVRPITVSDRDFETAVNAGTVKWAVTQEGELFIVPKYVQGQEISHAVITNGEPVLAAGEADISGFDDYYYLLSINNHSGHYQPSLSSLEIGRTAFKANGITTTD
ncbi:hypothetical protein [Scytonema sp. NUACC26]|uniref:hypothetical protein n=1 Tax=Scytonema sp. NUACC26 TaxID=3140176 RepID=UPI0034DC9A04